MKKRLFILLALLPVMIAFAQDNRLSTRLYGTVGHSYAEDFYGALSAVADYKTADLLTLTGGVEMFRGRGYAATAAWQCNLPWWGKHLFLYNRYLYRLFARWNLNEYSTHVALGYESKHWRLALGMANRIMSPFRPYDNTGSTEYVLEPFNVMYEFQYQLNFGRDDRWNMALRISDYDDFVTDRAYQPIFSATTGRQLGHGLTGFGRLVCYPTGMLSLSANYYQIYLNLGVQKQW